MNKVLRSGLFLLILVLLMTVCGLVFRPKNNDYNSKIQPYSSSGILGEADDSIDVVFLGDSEAYCAFNPLQIWKDSGITSFVSSEVGQLFYEIPECLELAFYNQSPKIVFLETNAIYQGFPGVDMAVYYTQKEFPLLRYHNRWKKMEGIADWFKTPDYSDIRPEKGYHFSTEVVPADTSEYMIPTEDVEMPFSGNIKILEKMRDYCNARGAQLILVSVPNTLNWDYLRHNALAEISEDLGIPFMDMNTMTEEIPIDWAVDTMDAGDHVNYDGSVKITDYITEYLVNTGLFADKRQNPEYSRWHEYVEQFMQENFPEV